MYTVESATYTSKALLSENVDNWYIKVLARPMMMLESGYSQGSSESMFYKQGSIMATLLLESLELTVFGIPCPRFRQIEWGLRY